jgi:hypothetical protein
MSDIARHGQGAIDLNGVVLSNILEGSVAVNSALQKAILHASGDLIPTLGATITNAPTIAFVTHDIDLIAAPTKITAATVITFRAYDESAGYGSGYISLAIAAGLIVPVSLSANAGGEAVLNCIIHPISSDGTTNPVIVGTTSKTLAVHGDAYTLGDLGIGGAISGVQNINFNFGYNIASNAGENGKPFPTLAYYDKQSSVLTSSVTQLAAATQVRLMTGQSTTAITASFLKLAEGAVPSGTYTITMAKALIEANSIQGGSPSTVNLTVTPIYDGTGNDYATFASA